VRFLVPPRWAGPPVDHRIAGCSILAPATLPSLAGFRRDAVVDAALSGRVDSTPVDRAARRVEVFLGGGPRLVGVHPGPQYQHLDLGDLGHLAIARDGSWVDGSALNARLPTALLEELLLGPGLVVALAARGIWCLHASAVVGSLGAIVFVGESGRGKSTLAARLERHGFGRLADDVLPLQVADATAPVRAAFPQLKLPADRQPGAMAPERLALEAIYLIPTTPEESDARGVEIIPLAPGDALTALLRHTVAARLFTADLLRAHLGACGALAERVAVRRLRLPLRWEALPEACRLIGERHAP